ncbi:MAG: chemotaxis response regulator [uncultured bacterium]|nr:MAG: chemotaxis response regulator [uncultured bacterium]
MAKIVVVDDASFMRGSLKFILETAGHEIVGMGKDGAEAEQLYKELMPDLMTMDILMKGVDGLTALKKIRENYPEAKIVMVTALGQETKEAEARDLGAAGYIRKPFKQKEIVDAVAAVLAG